MIYYIVNISSVRSTSTSDESVYLLIIMLFYILILVFIIHKRIVITIKQWPYFLFMSLVGIVAPFLLIAYGQKNIDSSLAGILMSTMPISTLILSHFFLDDERMTKTKFVGFIIARPI